MADTADSKPSVMDTLLGNLDKLGTVYQKVTLANKGVPTVSYETKGNGVLAQQGQPADVTGSSPLADAINNVTKNAAMAYTAKQASDSMPYIVGMMALGITIFLLTRK